ncbi:MAG: TetR/AcrR family transcriptional regulator [Stenotrophobium sp.]
MPVVAKKATPKTAPLASHGGQMCAGHAQLLASAKALFSRHGYDSASMSQIAAHAGVSKANIYHHYESKQALYLAVLRMACDEHAGRVEAMLEDAAPSTQKISRLLAADLQEMFERPEFPRLVMREISQQGARTGKVLADEILRRDFIATQALFEQGQARGEFRRDMDSAIATTQLKAAAVFFFQSYEVLRHRPELAHAVKPARYAELACDLLFKGLLAAPRKAAMPLPRPIPAAARTART